MKDEDLKDATEPYTAGWKVGEMWVISGGNQSADGPSRASEEYYNGFIDRLAKARKVEKETVH